MVLILYRHTSTNVPILSRYRFDQELPWYRDSKIEPAIDHVRLNLLFSYTFKGYFSYILLSSLIISIYESCPTCNKPLQGISASTETDRQGTKRTSITCQKTCTSCRQKVGFCFVCQERVESLFVWCPGCGHGGHLHCALEWYSGGNEGKALEELCPSGCGKRDPLFSICF